MAQLFTGTAVSFHERPYSQAVAEPDGSKLYILAWNGSVAKLATSTNHGVTWQFEDTPITVTGYDRGVSRGRDGNVWVWSSPTKGYINIWQRTGADQYTLVVANYQFTTYANDVYGIHVLIASTGDMHLLWCEAPGGSPAYTFYHRKRNGGAWGSATVVWSADAGGSGNSWKGRVHVCIGKDNIVHAGGAKYANPGSAWFYSYYDTSWHGGSVPSDTLAGNAPALSLGCIVPDEATGDVYWLRVYNGSTYTVGLYRRQPGQAWAKLATLTDVADVAGLAGLCWHRRRGELAVIYQRSDTGAVALRWWRGGALTAHRTLNSETPRTDGGAIIPDTQWDIVIAYNKTATFIAIADTYVVSVAPTVSVTAPAGTEADPAVLSNVISLMALSGVYSSDVVPMASRRHRVFDEDDNPIWDSGIIAASAPTGGSVVVAVPAGVLKYGQVYWWQWWAQDTAGYESAWSSAGWFLGEVTAPAMTLTPEAAQARIRVDAILAAECLAGFRVYRGLTAGGLVRHNLLLVPAVEVRRNLLAREESDLEAGINGWISNHSTVSIAHDVTSAWQGCGSLKVTCSDVVNFHGVRGTLHDVQPGRRYVGSAWVTGVGHVRIGLRTPAGPWISIQNQPLVLNGQYQATYVAGTIPEGITQVGVDVVQYETASPAVFWVDGVQLEQLDAGGPDDWLPGGVAELAGEFLDDVAACGQAYYYAASAVADDGYESALCAAAQASVTFVGTWLDDLRLPVAPTGFEVQEEFTGSIAPALGRPYPVVFRRQAGRRLYLAGTCLDKADKDALAAILRAPGPHRYVDPLGEALRVEVAAPVRFSQVRPYDPDQLIYSWSAELVEVF